MDPGQMGELRRWAEHLAGESDSPEARAAARAILLLADEVDRLNAELETGVPASVPVAAGDDGPPDEPGPPSSPPATPLRAWFGKTLGSGRDRPPPENETERQARRRLELRARRRRGLRRLAVLLVAIGALVFATFAIGARLTTPSLNPQGPANGTKVGRAGLKKLAFAIRSGSSTVRNATWTLDGYDVSSRAIVVGDTAILRGAGLPDGSHRLSVHASGGFPGSGATHSWRFAIDTTPPAIGVAKRVPIESGSPVRVTGTIEPDATLVVAGRRAAVLGGRFTVSFPSRPARPVVFRARDPLGNASRKLVSIEIVPRRPPLPVHAVHVTSYAWATPSLRDPVLQLADEHRIDAVELDLKDESGAIGWNAPIPLARKIGSSQKIFDLRAAVRLLHSKGVRVIGRLVAFRDPILASAAWKAGDRDEVIQTLDGGQYLGSGYGGFTNFANPVVRRYNVDIAVRAAKLGVDEVLYDYVRRPDGPLSTMTFPGLKGSAEASIASFLAEARAGLAPYKTFLGASVFGVAATRPEEVAQNIPMMAQHLDYVAPMVYPSHWGPGEYDVANPNAEPYQIVYRSLKDFEKDVRGTGARVVPWLQDFSLGITYGAPEVKAQIDAARDDGIDEFLLWDPAVTYTTAALIPMTGKGSAAAGRTATAVAPKVKANELGQVPVLMYHQLLPDGGGDFDLAPSQFRKEIQRLWREGYDPIKASDLIHGTIDVPAGKTPVVLTFDDSTNNQLSFKNGKLDPNSAVGILEAFAAKHPGFRATGTFFVLRHPFTGGGVSSDQALRWLVSHGYELGDHTYDHKPLGTLSDADVESELVRGAQVIDRAEPGAKIVSMALPLGSYPKNTKLAVSGSSGGRRYRFGGVFLVGANPSPSPFSTKFDPTNIPRIRTSPHPSFKYGSSWWLDLLQKDPGLRYVSDGDPDTIAFPASEQDQLAARFRTRARPY
jgi:peptidoglycan/xylan/chitin deacetylase (PgdA/CDA1 family)